MWCVVEELKVVWLSVEAFGLRLWDSELWDSGCHYPRGPLSGTLEGNLEVL